MLRELREAVLDHERRWVGQPMKVDILSSVWWRPFVGRADTDALGYERLKFVDKWLAHLHVSGIAQPTAEDYLKYFESCRSAQPLMHLQEAFDQLGLPAVASIAIELPKAITRKRSECAPLKPVLKQASATRVMSLPPTDLPGPWQDGLSAMRSGQAIDGRRPPAPSVVRTIESALCQYAYYCEQNGYPARSPCKASAGTLGGWRRHRSQAALACGGRRLLNGAPRRYCARRCIWERLTS